MKKLALMLFVVTALTFGCAKAQWSATGGSRADATVELSYEMDVFTTPPEDDMAALELATQRCKSWGYVEAEAFGGVKKQRVDEHTTLVTKTFQCIGKGDSAVKRK